MDANLSYSQEEITCFRISETWLKHATPCFRYVYLKVVRFRCIRSNGNARKRHETGNGNTGYPSCFRNGLTCFCHVSVYGFLQFRPVIPPKIKFEILAHRGSQTTSPHARRLSRLLKPQAMGQLHLLASMTMDQDSQSLGGALRRATQ